METTIAIICLGLLVCGVAGLAVYYWKQAAGAAGLEKKVLEVRAELEQELNRYQEIYNFIQSDTATALGCYSRRSSELLYEVFLLFGKVRSGLRDIDRLIECGTPSALKEADYQLQSRNQHLCFAQAADTLHLCSDWTEMIEVRLTAVLEHTDGLKERAAKFNTVEIKPKLQQRRISRVKDAPAVRKILASFTQATAPL